MGTGFFGAVEGNIGDEKILLTIKISLNKHFFLK